MIADENPLRAELKARGAIREADDLTHIEPSGPVLKLDDFGRAVARQRIAQPEPERGEWKRERDR